MKRVKSRALVRPVMGVVLNAVFSMLGAELVRGARVLDLYAGFGTYGLRALSAGAAEADFVERSSGLCAELTEKLAAKGGAGRVFCGSAPRVLARLTGKYDVVFLDPPYAYNAVSEVTSILAKRGLVSAGGVLVYEHGVREESAELLQGVFERYKVKRYGDTAVSLYRFNSEGGSET